MLALALALALALTNTAVAAQDETKNTAQKIYKAHAISMYDEPRYGPDFKHFDYVNPNAPKGGRMTLAAPGTFDSFHTFISKGNAASIGSIETLMMQSADEPFTNYGLIAQTLEWPEDRSWVIFNLRPEARWHDGKPITAEDVAWTFETLITKGSPQYRYYYAAVEKPEILGERRIRFAFKEKGNRELPLIVGQLPVLPKHYWADKDFEKTTLKEPLGSGPYKLGKFEAGRYLVRKRVDDYWGKDLPLNIGQNNFDEYYIRYYLDTLAIRLALKSGEIDYRSENQAKAWAVDYEVPVIEKGWLNKEQIPTATPEGMQAFVLNTRRERFKDIRVRKALALAFDFEWTNRNLFNGAYTRSYSYFSNSELAATGKPKGEELAILNRYRAQLQPQVFDTIPTPATTDGTGWPRQNLLKAADLLQEAGYVVKDFKLVNKVTGQPFEMEFLLVQQAFERIVLPYARNLKRLGINARTRLVDTSQYINRLRLFDFDTVITGWGQTETPGNEQREYWSSQAADNPASRNYAGIKHPVIDELVNLLPQAETRSRLVAYANALDRILLNNHYVVPNWHLPAVRILYWDKFSRPASPVKSGVLISRWWLDETKVSALANAHENDTSLTVSVGDGEQPSGNLWLTALLALAIVLWLGWLVMRRVMRTNDTKGAA